MKSFFAKIKAVVLGAGVAVVSATQAQAAMTMPSLPLEDVEAAGTAVAALIAGVAIVKVIIGMIRSAGR